MDALAFVGKPPAKLGPLYVLPGDEPFLKRQVVKTIREQALGGDGDDAAFSTYPGDKAQFAEVFDELSTAPFFSPRRLVVVDNADPFVTRFRAVLERKITDLPPTGILVLDVKTWASNTRLAKLVDAAATIVCKAPAAYGAPAWCSAWAKRQYGKQLAAPSANLLVELAGPELGLLDQELAKLAIYVGTRASIEPDDVDRLVGHHRAENTFKIFDALAQGRTREALMILERLFDQGEEPMRLLGAFAMQLRRLAQAARWNALGKSLGAALEQAGVPPFAVSNAEQQLRHIGRHRAFRLFDGLLELHLGLRGSSPLPERTQFERFLLRLAQPAGK